MSIPKPIPARSRLHRMLLAVLCFCIIFVLAAAGVMSRPADAAAPLVPTGPNGKPIID